jgi:hypothetical protein
MNNKSFNKKYMHPTRRKLVDMVLNGGEYQKETTIGFDSGNRDKKREIGEIWTDANGIEWEQRSYGKVQLSSLTNTMSEVRKWLQEQNECKNEKCSKTKYGYTDKKLIKKTGYCSNCLAEKETPIRLSGLWDVYEKYKLSQNMLSYGMEVLKQLRQALSEVRNEYEIVNENGSIEKWKMEKSVDELKEEIQQTIDNSIKEIKDVLIVRDECWEKLRDKNYELVSPPIVVEI